MFSYMLRVKALTDCPKQISLLMMERRPQSDRSLCLVTIPTLIFRHILQFKKHLLFCVTFVTLKDKMLVLLLMKCEVHFIRSNVKIVFKSNMGDTNWHSILCLSPLLFSSHC